MNRKGSEICLFRTRKMASSDSGERGKRGSLAGGRASSLLSLIELALRHEAEWINPSATAVSHTAPKQVGPRELTSQRESRNRHRAALYEGFKN